MIITHYGSLKKTAKACDEQFTFAIPKFENIKIQGSQICKIWPILSLRLQNNKHSFDLTFFATNTIYVNCKCCKP